MKNFIYKFLFLLSIFIVPFTYTKAFENKDLGTFISDGRFYSFNQEPSADNKGFQISYSSSPYSAIPTDTNWFYGVRGGALVQCDMSFVKDFYYSVTYNFLIDDYENYPYPDYSSWGNKVAVCSNFGCIPNQKYENISTGTQVIPYMNDLKVASFTVIFKAENNGTCVSIGYTARNKNTNSQQLQFVGYKYSSLGSAPLTESQIKNALSSDFADLKNHVDAMKDEQVKTNKKLDDLNKNQQDTNKKLDDVKGAITSEENPKLEGLNNSAGWLPAGPLDSILNLPLSFLNNLSTNLSKTCQPVTLPLPFVDKTLDLPCLNSIYSQIEGLDTWITGISIIASVFILFTYLINLYKWVDDTLTFRENNYIDNWGGM
jgi:outer membrane murein-binding lipoprotein Lpp